MYVHDHDDHESDKSLAIKRCYNDKDKNDKSLASRSCYNGQDERDERDDDQRRGRR